MKPLIHAFSGLAAIAVTACSTTDAAIAAETYVIDPSHTHVQFSVQRFGFSDVIGEFRDVSGTITLDQDAPENSSVAVEIAIASLVSGDDTRDGHVQGEAWLNAEAFPIITFQSTNVELTGDDTALVTGDLNLHGATLPVTLDVTLNRIGMDPATRGEAAGFSATGQLTRSEFGMETAIGLVGDETAIRIEALAHLVEE